MHQQMRNQDSSQPRAEPPARRRAADIAGMVLSPHLNQDELPLQGLPIRPFFPEAEVDLKRWLLLYLTFLVGNELCRR